MKRIAAFAIGTGLAVGTTLLATPAGAISDEPASASEAAPDIAYELVDVPEITCQQFRVPTSSEQVSYELVDGVVVATAQRVGDVQYVLAPPEEDAQQLATWTVLETIEDDEANSLPVELGADWWSENSTCELTTVEYEAHCLDDEPVVTYAVTNPPGTGSEAFDAILAWGSGMSDVFEGNEETIGYLQKGDVGYTGEPLPLHVKILHPGWPHFETTITDLPADPCADDGSATAPDESNGAGDSAEDQSTAGDPPVLAATGTTAAGAAGFAALLVMAGIAFVWLRRRTTNR